MSEADPLLTPDFSLKGRSQVPGSQVKTPCSAKRKLSTGTKQPDLGPVHLWKRQQSSWGQHLPPAGPLPFQHVHPSM